MSSVVTATLLPDGKSASGAVAIAQGVLVGESAPAIDAVPLIDQATASILGRATGFTIYQRPSITEMLLGCERSNIYDVFDNEGRHIFFAKERSECWNRLCCAPRHSFFIEFKHSSNIPPMMVHATDIDSLPVAMTLEREGCPSKCCLGCCVCFPNVCADGMYLHAGAVGTAEAGKLKAGNPGCVSFATQPKFGGGFTPTVNIMERAATGGGGGAAEPAWSTLAKLEGPTVFGGCAELCQSSKFSVSSLSPGTMEGKVKTADLAEIVKRKPQDLEGMLREMVTDADMYTLVFNPAAQLAPQQKASLLASLILTDFMFFERDDAACSGRGCNLCNFYCAGCLIPCSCVSGSAGNSGAGGGGGFMADQ